MCIRDSAQRLHEFGQRLKDGVVHGSGIVPEFLFVEKVKIGIEGASASAGHALNKPPGDDDWPKEKQGYPSPETEAGVPGQIPAHAQLVAVVSGSDVHAKAFEQGVADQMCIRDRC